VEKGTSVDLVVSKGGVPGNWDQVTIAVPKEGIQPIDVRVEITDVVGRRIIYRNHHRPGDVFRIMVEWKGREAKLDVYYNGEFSSELVLKVR